MKTIVQCFALIFFIGLTLSVSAQKTKIKGSGNLSSESRSVGNFDGISIGGAWKVTLQKGNEGDLTITTDDNLLQHVETYVKNGTLYIGTDDVWINNVSKMEITIRFNEIESIRLSGACDLEAHDAIKANHFELRSSGAAEIALEVDANEFKGEFSGASKAMISGSANSADINISGAGLLNAYDFEVEDLEVNVSGAGSVKIHVTKHLEARVSGAGSVRYKGSPTTSKAVSGAGSIKGT